MKTFSNAAFLFLMGAVFCGCSTSHHAGPVYRAGDENPPDFLTSPVAMALTNLNGFSAHVISTVKTGDEPAQTKSGELLARDGRLLFQPALNLKKKHLQAEGGLFYIWNTVDHSGYVLSEALQGYAPITPDVVATGPLTITRESIQEVIDGQPCHKCEAAVSLASGRSVLLTLWESDQTGHFPVRIEAVNGLQRTTLDLSDVRMEYPPQDLFLPPDGFTAYENGARLMNELILRDASYSKKSQIPESDEPLDTRTSDWHGAPAGGQSRP